MLSRQLAFEWGPRGVRSNVVAPGLVRTPLSEAFYADEATKAAREAVVPMRRIGRTQDIADAVLFFASDRASYISGQEVIVDGGYAQSLMSHVPRPGYAKT
jgi:NAD(P)-dependent dehydrogenase (short-subunit alcohol dehydrogenase family)